MNIQSNPIDNHQVKLTVEIEPERLEEAKRRGARKISGKAKIAGFRPGKAPYNVVVRNYGEAAILEEALDLLVSDIYPTVIEEANIKPYGPGKLDNVVSMDPLVLEFIVPLEAEVDLGEYTAISKPYELPVISEKQVERVLESLRERQAVLEPVERPAQEGDLVSVQLSARRLASGDTATDQPEDDFLIRERTIQVVIKPEAQSDDPEDVEWPFEDFSRRLLSLVAGQSIEFTYSYPEDTQYESLRGTEAEFQLKVEEVKSRTLPELNDDFATSVGEYETMDALMVEVRTGLERQAEQEYNEAYDAEILETAIAQANFKYPPEMLEDQVNDVVHDLTHRLEKQGMDMDLYLKSRSMEMDALKEEAKPAAEARLKRSLFLYELADKENIQVSQEELQQESLSTFNYLASTLPEQEARKLRDEKVYRNLINNIMAEMLSRKATERLREISSGRAVHPEVESELDEPVSTEEPIQENILEAPQTLEAPEITE